MWRDFEVPKYQRMDQFISNFYILTPKFNKTNNLIKYRKTQFNNKSSYYRAYPP